MIIIQYLLQNIQSSKLQIYKYILATSKQQFYTQHMDIELD